MDIYNLITKQYKLSSYKLDSMAKHFLGDEKDDVSPKQIFQYQVCRSACVDAHTAATQTNRLDSLRIVLIFGGYIGGLSCSFADV